MALGFGANARLIAAYEATYGTPLSDGYHRLGFSRYGLSARQQLIDNDLLGEGRDESLQFHRRPFASFHATISNTSRCA